MRRSEFGQTASLLAFRRLCVRAAFPFRATHVWTEPSSCFTCVGLERACKELGIAHRTTKPYTLQTNGMVECFSRRIQDEILCITVHSHRALEDLLRRFAQPIRPDASGC